MPDVYIDRDYLRSHLGTSLEQAINDIPGIDLDLIIQGATAKVQSAMRNSGYTPPSASTAAALDGDADEATLREATLGAVVNRVHQIPEASLDLPEGWNSAETWGSGWLVTGIWSGQVQLARSVSVGSAVGGALFSDSSSTSATGRPQRASRSELEDF